MSKRPREAEGPHIVLLVAARRGLLFLQKVAELVPSARLTVFSFKEDEHEPPFLESIRAFTESAGGELHVARKVGLAKYTDLWADLANGGIDLMFCVGWRYLVEHKIYSLPRRGTFVFHDSMLPQYRGFAPTVWAIVQGEACTGVSLMTMAGDVDSGDIVDQAAVTIAQDDTIATVMERVTAAYLEMLEKNLPRLLDGSFTATPQDHTLATYTVKRTPLDNLIRWERPADECYNLVRAITRPYPGAVTFLDGRKYTVWSADRADTRRVAVRAPGRIFSFGAEGISVVCGDGQLLRLTKLMGEDGDELVGEALAQPSIFKLSSTFSDYISDRA